VSAAGTSGGPLDLESPCCALIQAAGQHIGTFQDRRRKRKMTTYQEMLRDPKWVEKSSQIKARDNFACVKCGAKNVRLHVHHCYYLYDDGFNLKPPWEYPDGSLLTLCYQCHQEEHSFDCNPWEELKKAIGNLGFTTSDIIHLVRGFNSSALSCHSCNAYAHFIDLALRSTWVWDLVEQENKKRMQGLPSLFGSSFTQEETPFDGSAWEDAHE